MSCPLLPIKELAKRLEGCEDPEFVTVLNTLRSPAYVDERLLKSDLALLATKTLALLRSGQNVAVWRGCHAAVVICSYNPLMLCGHGGQLLSAIYSKLEHKVEFYSSSVQTPQSAVLLQALVFALASLINLMRGKPALSRESLVPQLKVIIPMLVKLAVVQPKLALPVLKTLLYKNTTTFRPFANKFRAVLTKLLSDEYENCDNETQRLICDNFAYLHLIKMTSSNVEDENQAHHKSYQDDTWRIGIFSILSKFKPVLDLCGEFLDLEQDKEIQKLINSLELGAIGEASDAGDFLPGLKLDMNTPLTLWEAPRRLSLLLDLLSSFMTLQTPYPVRIPIGVCISVAESLLSITSNYLPLKREVRRDSELTAVLYDMLPQIQFVGVELLSVIIRTYGKLCLSLLPSILSSLELFIPLQQKSSKIDFVKCVSLKHEFLTVFKLVSSLAPHMGHHLNEVDLIKKLVDISLHLTEDQSAFDFSSNQDTKSVQNIKSSTKKKQKKDHSAAAISDLYVQPEIFIFKCSEDWLSDVNNFLRMIISNWSLPSTQHLKILRYSVSTSLKWKEQKGYIPESFVQLLRAEVLNPGAERVSILPIAISLLKNANDDVFDLLCHPRLPMSLVYSVKPSIEAKQDEAEDFHEDTNTEAEEAENDRRFQPAVKGSESLGNNSPEPLNNANVVVSETVVASSFASETLVTPEVQQVFETSNHRKRDLDGDDLSSETSKRSKVTAKAIASEISHDVLKETSETVTANLVVENDTVVADSESNEPQTAETHTSVSDGDSDIEIPALNVSGDEESDEDSDEESA